MSGATMLVQLSVAELEAIVAGAVSKALASCTAASPAPQSCLLARSALAMALACSLATVDRMVNDGCPFVIVGRTKRFDMARVQAWLATRTIAPAAVAPKPTPVASLAGVRRLSRGAAK